MKSFFVFICLACIGSYYSTNVSNSNPPTKINLKGGLASGGLMRNLPPVEAYQNAFNVQIVFNGDLGNLDIEVLDETGNVVFQTIQNATAGGSLTIYTNGWKDGEYILVIMDELGGSLEGKFVIEK